MAWPSDADYREAIQTPQAVFSDPELKQGIAQMDKMGLPRPRSGAAATVYKIQCGSRSWAVRCFRYELQDQQQRYAAITSHLQHAAIVHTVGFSFLLQGIRIRGKWFPILKMEWVDGESLLTYVQKHLSDPQALLDLARKWITMVQTLEYASIAHGDLQHGNVLVRNGELKLVDYDGMFVPILQGYLSLEVGHKNYQHPLRTSSDFGSYLDTFSSWTIYLSLVLLSVDPSLWTKVNGGDDCLLFRKQDFDQPDTSAVFRILEKHRDSRVQSAATLFRSLLSFPPRQMPGLNGELLEKAEPATPVRSAFSTDWLSDHVKREPRPLDLNRSKEIAAPSIDSHAGDPSWIADFLVPATTATKLTFSRPVERDRIIAVCSVIATLLSLLWSTTTHGLASIQSLALATACVLLNFVYWLYSYRQEPHLAAFRVLQSKVKESGTKVDQTKREIKDLHGEIQRFLTEFKNGQQRLRQDLSALKGLEQQAIREVQSRYQTQLTAISSQRATANQQEAAALQRVASETNPLLNPLERELNQLDRTESEEIATLLKQRQQEFLTSYMKGFRIDDAKISGVGPSFRLKLQRAGYHTAADIDRNITNVPGIGPSRAASIHNWRQSIIGWAQNGLPRSLPSIDLGPIQGKFSKRRFFLQEEIQKLKARRKAQESTITSNADAERNRLIQKDSALQVPLSADLERVKMQHRPSYESIDQAQVTIARERDEKTKNVELKLQMHQKNLFKLRYEEGRLKISTAPYRDLTFSRYVRRILGT